ncbi:MAG: transglutaminase-like domain-containing protein [Dokdonella sp.]|nr:transglutaminase-like domain-containing protein [Dokdonella sp.]
MGIRLRGWTLGGIGLLLACACAAQATPGSAYAELQRHLVQPDQAVDFAAAKIAIDRLIDPSVDAAAVQRELDRLTRAVAARTPAGLTPRARMDVLLSTLYTAGDWNDHRPFSYDLDDPMGRRRENKLLSTYLRTRKGNCVSMPILVTIIGQRLGLVVTLATGPEHVMTKFADGENWLNVEATAGGYKWDSSYERDLDIGALALENEIYLRPLAPREAVGVMASTLMEALAANRRADDLMAVADMVLAANPTDVVAIIQKANAYYLQLEQRYNSRYARPIDIPPALQADYAMRSAANLEWFAKAEFLGWRPPTTQNRANYLQSVDDEKLKRGLP